MKLSEYVNVFQGWDECELPKAEGVASSWHFIKSTCGNAHPGAALPFGAMTVCAYSGGYPTGYGWNGINSDPNIPKIHESKKFCGVSHLHHTGAGSLGFF